MKTATTSSIKPVTKQRLTAMQITNTHQEDTSIELMPLDGTVQTASMDAALED